MITFLDDDLWSADTYSIRIQNCYDGNAIGSKVFAYPSVMQIDPEERRGGGPKSLVSLKEKGYSYYTGKAMQLRFVLAKERLALPDFCTGTSSGTIPSTIAAIEANKVEVKNYQRMRMRYCLLLAIGLLFWDKIFLVISRVVLLIFTILRMVVESIVRITKNTLNL